MHKVKSADLSFFRQSSVLISKCVG